jgi:hypothetical protein
MIPEFDSWEASLDDWKMRPEAMPSISDAECRARQAERLILEHFCWMFRINYPGTRFHD